MMIEELELYATEAARIDLALSIAMADLIRLVAAALHGSVPEMQQVVMLLVVPIEQARAAFRRAGVWPPRLHEAKKVARWALG